MILKSGQLVKAKAEIIPIIYHYGIIIVEDGEIYILHNSPAKSSVIELFENWEATRSVVSVIDTELIGFSNEYILNRFDSVCKRDYILFQYNCEHFVDCMLNRPQRSEQVRTWVIGLSIFAFAYHRYTNKKRFTLI